MNPQKTKKNLNNSLKICIFVKKMNKMERKKLSIGVQSFRFFQNENMIYVDKTQKIYELMQLGIHNFIVRPRRFGKSLLLNTLYNIYEGNREAFEGTWIYDNIDWEAEKRPVLRIDFTGIDSSSFSLEQGLQNYLRPIAENLAINTEMLSGRDLFKQIIERLSVEKRIIILVDEYEMPVTDFVGKDEVKLQENIDTLKKFYGVMKYASEYIHRSYITGVSKIGKIGVLSDLNMLNDLTLDERFTTLFGYTETELRHYYAAYITEAAERYKVSELEILAQIKQHYNGYSWDGIEKNKVYNPFSIVNFFQSFDFQNYWFETGTPTVLVRGARRQQLDIEELSHIEVGGDLLKSANLREFYSIALLFQAGYLTIKTVEVWSGERVYTLGFPNQEVHGAFAKYLLAEYVDKPVDYVDYTLSHRLRMHLEREQLKGAFQIFLPVIAGTPYDITKHTEGFFHTIMHVLMYSTNLYVFSELETAQGRLDTVCIAQKAIYIFEFKINATAEKALAQIKELNYATRFRNESKALYLIGVNFLTDEKRINDILVEKWENGSFVRLKGDFVPVG